ncbi:hypothetical protein LCGC14_0395460 [marine sediment metagenome]|uniref:Uncharacterized protein n=1 Tax=marine sediment metagenome TaxID=412755 RepID=A0A0F9SYE1_9ZZZZ
MKNKKVDENNNKDLLDLCRLNLMEENITDSSDMDREATLKAIEWKRNNLVSKIKEDKI